MNNCLFVAWRSAEPSQSNWGPVGVLERTPTGSYRFGYTKGARSLPGFRPFPGMARYDVLYESDELFPIFANRLLNARRPEYEPSLMWSGFEAGEQPNPIQLLGVTEGRRQTDSLEVFPCPEPDADGCFAAKFFLHGLRHASPEAIARVSLLKNGELLRIVPEDDNQFDRYAVAVWTEGVEHRIGYVPRYLARDIRLLHGSCGPDFATLLVERINPGAPLQQRLLCQMKACWPPSFRPCSGEEFQPIVGTPRSSDGSDDARAAG